MCYNSSDSKPAAQRRWMLLLLCTAMLTALFGCSHTNDFDETSLPERKGETTSVTHTETEGESVPAQTTTEPSTDEKAEDFLVAITMNPASKDDRDEDEATVFSFQYQEIQVLVSEYPGAAEVIEADINNSIHSTWEAAQSVRSWAQGEYEARSQDSDWDTCYVRILYSPARIDTRVFSLYGVIDDYTGGTHPNVSVVSSNYDTKTGEALTLQDVLCNEEALDDLRSLVEDTLKRQSETQALFDYEEAVAARFDLTNAASANWYFSHEGLVFYFSPYEIASYGSGVILAEISYENLTGILNEVYFPEKSNDFENYSIGAAKAGEISMEQFDVRFHVTLDNGGEEIVVFTNSALYQVELETGYWNIFDNKYYVDQVLFAANRMTSQDLLQIQTYIPDTMPNLRLTAKSGEAESKTLYISQSGEDGSILLLDAADVW